MTLKAIAIGILVLMGLSSVMKPKSFRLLLGGLGALCMAVLFTLVVNRPASDETATPTLTTKVQRAFGLQPNWTESATRRSRTILEDYQEGKLTDPSINDLVPQASGQPTPAKPTPQRKRFFISKNPIRINRSDLDPQEFVEQMQIRINEYLEQHRKNYNDVGVEQLTHRNLDPRLIQGRLAKMEDGSEAIFLVFDEKYVEHVRAKGLHVLMKERLKLLARVIAGAGAVLLLAFGTLKTINRRNEPMHVQDYLQQSDISMV
jgi:hypothetical protein